MNNYGGASGGSNRGQAQFLRTARRRSRNMGDLAGYATMQWGNWEFIEQSLYTSFSYVAAGVASQRLFQLPVGQGTGFGGSTKTISDTNMQSPGLLSNGLMQLVTSIELEVQVSTRQSRPPCRRPSARKRSRCRSMTPISCGGRAIWFSKSGEKLCHGSAPHALSVNG